MGLIKDLAYQIAADIGNKHSNQGYGNAQPYGQAYGPNPYYGPDPYYNRPQQYSSCGIGFQTKKERKAFKKLCKAQAKADVAAMRAGSSRSGGYSSTRMLSPPMQGNPERSPIGGYRGYGNQPIRDDSFDGQARGVAERERAFEREPSRQLQPQPQQWGLERSPESREQKRPPPPPYEENI